MFEKFTKKTKEEKKEILKNLGIVTLIGASAAALVCAVSYSAGYKDGIETILDFGKEIGEQHKEVIIESKEGGEA